MRDVVIVGGGVSGLAAAYQLEKLKVAYTLIEVKQRLGGSIFTERRDGSVIDGGPMAIPQTDELNALAAEFGLSDEVLPIDGGLAIFKNGTQALVDALVKSLTGTRMMRMAVSSLGYIDADRHDCFGVCLENGLLLDTRALIVAAPARYAAHMLYDLQPEVSLRLADYLYDSIIRLSLVYRREAISLPPVLPPDMAFVHCYWTDSPHRVPSGHVLVQLGVRVRLNKETPTDWITHVLEEIRWPTNPVIKAAYSWPEADPLTCHHPDHMDNMAAVERLLPDGVVLVGSDYRAFDLTQRVLQGRAAARKIAAGLGRGT